MKFMSLSITRLASCVLSVILEERKVCLTPFVTSLNFNPYCDGRRFFPILGGGTNFDGRV